MGFLAGSKHEIKHYSLLYTNNRLTGSLSLSEVSIMPSHTEVSTCRTGCCLQVSSFSSADSLSLCAGRRAPLFNLGTRMTESSPSTGAWPHLKTLPRHLLKTLDSTQVHGAHLCHLWPCLPQLRAPRGRDNLLWHSSTFQNYPGSLRPPDTSTKAGTGDTGLCFGCKAFDIGSSSPARAQVCEKPHYNLFPGQKSRLKA